jgi:DNA-binding CsgD family transcriptional regulator
MSAMLRKRLAGLSAEHREVIDLVYYHEKSVEVAEIVGIPENTVKTRKRNRNRRSSTTSPLRSKGKRVTRRGCREPAFDKSGGLFSIVGEGHGERLAGYGVCEPLRARLSQNSLAGLNPQHGEATADGSKRPMLIPAAWSNRSSIASFVSTRSG